MKALLLACVGVAACDLQRMQEQPRCERDGTLDGTPCNMSPPEGVVAYNDVAQAPPPLTRSLVLRGRDRYERFCAACHGLAGDADSEVNRWTRPRIPSLLSPAIVALPDERIVQSIAAGFGLMPPQPLDHVDRWATLHYVRVLQQPREEGPR